MNKKIIAALILVIALISGAMIFLRSSGDEPTIITEDLSSTPKAVLPAPSAPAQAPAPEPKPKKLSVTIASLPTLDDMKDLSHDEVHHTPEAVLEGARVIGKLIDDAEKNPELREETAKFLLECAEADKVVNAVRAVCWKNTLSSIEKWKVFVPISQANVPDKIKLLSSQIP